ncbi:uncharacterized protein BDV14DRAFT_202957 [Aspergillus stella-maris]|uniref:uncharacterized protein n=1 Tax=Aspergillus stella-maris TaxID=1810926 RepID=UPI003CCCE0AC
MPYTLEDAVGDALLHLQSISDHLRIHGQPDVATEIGRLSTDIVGAVEVAVARMQRGVERMDNNGGHHAITTGYNPPAYAAGSSRNSSNGSVSGAAYTGHGRGATPAQPTYHAAHSAATREPFHRQAVLTPVSQVHREQQALRSAGHYPAQAAPSSSTTASQPESWAQVLGTTTPTSSREGAQFPSPLSLSPNQNRNSKEVALSPPSSNAAEEIEEEKAGVVRVHGKANRADISNLTMNVHEGPLFEVRVETDNRARITFQNLSNALDFIKSDSQMMKSVGHGRFGPGYRVELIEVVEWDAPLRAMCQPVRERRRLSFARKGLFAGNMSHQKWRQDMHHVAGPGNVDFLWIFNSGNATAVFSSTAVARRVLETVNRWKECRVAYSGVCVSFSSDPCEKELNLHKSQKGPIFPKNGYNKHRR